MEYSLPRTDLAIKLLEAHTEHAEKSQSDKQFAMLQLEDAIRARVRRENEALRLEEAKTNEIIEKAQEEAKRLEEKQKKKIEEKKKREEIRRWEVDYYNFRRRNVGKEIIIDFICLL
jgi:hypothetical protein